MAVIMSYSKDQDTNSAVLYTHLIFQTLRVGLVVMRGLLMLSEESFQVVY